MHLTVLRRIPRTRLLSLTALTASLIAPVFAQSTSRLVGTVKDPSGAAVEDALVSLYRPAMNEPAVQSRTTNVGLFEFGAIPPESYRVTVEKSGFAPYEATNVPLSPGVETSLNGIVLVLGQQTTLVTAEQLVGVQNSDAEVSTTLTTAQLEGLPILQRNPLSLIPTQAGVVSGSGFAPFTTIDGLRTSASNVTLDGINVQDNTVRYNALNEVPNNLFLGQVNQFTLVTSNQSAIYGNGATQTAFVSPSGNNQLHGSVFYLNSPNLLNSNLWFQNSQGLINSFKDNQGGFTVGGPLLKEKLFGYLDYEFYRGNQSAGQAVTEEVPIENSGNTGSTLYSLGQALVKFAPPKGINANVASIFDSIPAPNLPGNIYEHASEKPQDYDNATGRLDYVPSQRNTFVASYLFNRNDSDILGQPSLFGSQNAAVEHLKADLVSGSWRYNPMPLFTNEVRGGLNFAPAQLVNVELTSPVYNLGPFQSLNPVSNFVGQQRRLKTVDLQDNASYVFGRHNIQFGVQVQLIRISGYLQNGTTPTVALGLAPKTCMPPMASSPTPACATAVLAGQYYRISHNFFSTDQAGDFGPVQNNNYLSLDNYAPYLQDNWKVTNKLALTLGLRYDYYTSVGNRTGIFYEPQLVNGNVFATFANPDPKYSPAPGTLYHPGNRNFAPSIGVAYDPFGRGRTVIRAAYGINYVNDDLIGTVINTLSQNTLYLGLGVSAPGVLPTLNQIRIPPDGSGIPGPGMNHILGVVDPNLHVSYVQEWSVGVQQEWAGFVFDLRYVGNHAAKLLRLDEFADVNNTAFYASNSSNSTYNALQFNVNRRLRPDLQFQANYTFSKALTDAGNPSAIFISPFRDPADHHLDKGPSPFDVRNAFKANLIYTVPLARRNAILGGWSVSAIATAQSGLPFSIVSRPAFISPISGAGNGIQTASTNLTGSALNQLITFNQTPYGPSIIAPSAINPTTGMANNQIFFAPMGQPGTLQPRSFNSPVAYDVDMGIQKRFRITERHSLELTATAVNVLNHPSFAFYDQTIFNNPQGFNNDTNLPGRNGLYGAALTNFGHSAYTFFDNRRFEFAIYYRF